MGLKRIIQFTIAASLVEWIVYLRFAGRTGIEVNPDMFAITIPTMILANFISAHIAQYIFTGRIRWKLK